VPSNEFIVPFAREFTSIYSHRKKLLVYLSKDIKRINMKQELHQNETIVTNEC